MSRDPVSGENQHPLTQNGYSYGDNNPVMNVDPDGLASFSNMTKNILRTVIKTLFEDLKSNTLTDLILLFIGGSLEAREAYIIGKTGFTLLERNLFGNSFKAFFKGSITYYFKGPKNGFLGAALSYASRFGASQTLESWFDRTVGGKYIDNVITKIENKLLAKVR